MDRVEPMRGGPAAAARDPQLFEEFCRRHVDAVTSFVARRVGAPHTVADLTAETFLAVLDSAHTYRPGLGSETAWLYGVARNVVSSERRRAARETRCDLRISGRRLLEPDDVARLEESSTPRARAVAPRRPRGAPRGRTRRPRTHRSRPAHGHRGRCRARHPPGHGAGASAPGPQGAESTGGSADRGQARHRPVIRDRRNWRRGMSTHRTCEDRLLAELKTELERALVLGRGARSAGPARTAPPAHGPPTRPRRRDLRGRGSRGRTGAGITRRFAGVRGGAQRGRHGDGDRAVEGPGP